MKEHSTRALLILAALALCATAAPSDLRAQQQPGRDVDDPVLARGQRVARATEQYDYTPRRPSDGDRDADGIADDLEQRLLDKFAPIFKYDKDENVHPLKVADYLGQAFLMFRHDGCADHPALPIGEVNLRSLLRQVHPTRCDHKGRSAASNAPPPRVGNPLLTQEFYYLSLSTCIRWSTECQRQAEDDCRGNPDPACRSRALAECHREFMRRQREAIRRGETIGAGEMCEDVGISRGFKREDRIEAYASVRPSEKAAGAYEIMVRVFYPQNTLQSLGFGYHVGDWEGVDIHVTRDERAFYVTYYQHAGKQVAARSPTDPRAPWVGIISLHRTFVPKFDDDTHLVVYVAAKSHASYPKDGTDGRGLLPADHHNGDDFVFRTQGRIVNVGRRERPSPGSEWIEFRGYWGQDWDPATALFIDLEGASPPTPRF